MSKGETKIKRGYKLSHQKLVLEVDLERQSLVGYADLTVVPQSRALHNNKIKLHCRQCEVTEVTVNGVKAPFTRMNYLEKVVPAEEYERDTKSFTARYKAALHASDQGDLIIDLPAGVSVQESNEAPLLNDIKLNGSTDSAHHVIRMHHSFSPLNVRIYYQLIQPTAGAFFVMPHPNINAYSRRVPHMYTHNQDDHGARNWMPTVDHVGERFTWEFEITVAAGLVAVASGELLEQVWVDDDETKKTYFYKQTVAVPARSVALAVGPFAIYPDPHVPSITHFCLPGRLKELQHTVDFLGKAYRFYEEYLHTPFPFESYKQVFIEDAYSDFSPCSSLTIFSSQLLHDETIIDQTLVTRRLLALALAQQWFGCYVGIKSWPDMWISAGFSGHLSSLFFRKMFGNNEYRYRIMTESEWVCANDNGPPLYNEYAVHPLDMATELVTRKSPLVVYMIEKHIGETAFRKLLNSLVSSKPASTSNPTSTTDSKDPNTSSTTPRDANGIAAPSTPSEKGGVDQTLSTKKLLKTLKYEVGKDMKSFGEKWIYGKGCPKLMCGFWFNRKRHQTEFALRQPTKADDRISSTLVIRINELDGSYDNKIDFDEEMHAYEFPCFSRTRKMRKKKKDGGDDKEADSTTVTPVASSKKSETPLLWLRIDPDMQWIHSITFRQPEYMWVHQLEEDRDVVAQHEAVKGLQFFPTSNALGALNRVVNDPRVFYRVRMEAAYSLSSPSTTASSETPGSADVHWIGLDHLLRTFKTLFYNADGTQLLPNTFADFCNYHLQKILPLAMAQVQDKEGRTPSDVLEFLLDLLKNNDNSLNAFSDNYYIESVILAISKTNTSGISDTDKIVKQIHRFLNMERLMPSYHNTVTAACVRALGDLQSSKRLDANLSTFKDYLRYGHFDDVRIVSAQALTRLGFTHPKARDPSVANTLLTIAESDPSPRIRARILEIISTPPPLPPNSPATAVNPDDRLYFDALYPHLDRLWELVNGPLTSLDSRVRGAALKAHNAVMAWGKQFGILADTPSQITARAALAANANKPVRVRAVVRGDPSTPSTPAAAPPQPSLGPGKKLLPKQPSSVKKRKAEPVAELEDVALPAPLPPAPAPAPSPVTSSEHLKIKIVQKGVEPPPGTTTTHHPPPSTSQTPTTPSASSSAANSSNNAKRRRQSSTPSTKAASAPPISPSTIKEEPVATPPQKASQPKRTSPSSSQPKTPPSTISAPPPKSTPAPPTPTTTPAPTPAAPSSTSTPTATPAPANPPGSLKINLKLKLGGVSLPKG